MRRNGYSLCIAAIACALAACASAARPDATRAGRAPLPAYDPATVPPAPDYAGPGNWASLPSVRDDGDMVPKGVPEPPQLRAPADVFFIHSAVPLRRAVRNADTRDVWFNGDVGQTTIRNQASAFNGCCAIYAPRYRQVNPAGAEASRDGEAALALAYSDIVRAFHEFRRRVGDRPFIVAGHGEGSRLARRLIEREIDGQPIAARMVAAYLVGDPLPLDWFGARNTVRHCAGEADTGCAVAWSIRIEGGKPSPIRAACNNPLSWTTGPAVAPRTAHRGAWMRNGYEFPEPLRAPDAGLIAARCGTDGTLYVSPRGEPYASRMAPDGSDGALDYQLVYMDLRHNAAARVAAFLARR